MSQRRSRSGAQLSERQSEILELIALGKSNKEIAHQLGLTTGTVKQHVHALFRKLGVRSRTMAVVRGASALAGADASGAAAAPGEAVAALKAPLEDPGYAKRLVTVVVIEPRPDPVRTAGDAAEAGRRVAVLRERVNCLAFAFDARSEALPGGGIAAWFGQPLAHGDDAKRAVAFLRVLVGGSGTRESIPWSAGVGTAAEVVGEGERGAVAYGAFRLATRLASLAEPGAPLACPETSRLALPAPSAPEEVVHGAPEGAALVGSAPRPSAAVARQWGGLPFLPGLVSNVRRGRSQWLAVESWPPEAGTRLIDAVGECLAAVRFPVRSLWLPLPSSGNAVAERLAGQLREAYPGEKPVSSGSLGEALARLGASGPAALLAYGIDALRILRDALGERGIERLRALPILIVAGAMHRAGAPQTVVRLLGSHPGASPFVRVLRMEVPAKRASAPDGIRPDVQAVLDALSAEAREIARLAADPHSADIEVLASALGLARDKVVQRCSELEAWGLLSVNGGKLEFRDEATAAAVRASFS